MIIKDVDIKAFKGIKNLKIEFNEDFNIIYGPNQSGKSSIVLFIKSMLYGVQPNKKLGELGSRASSIPLSGSKAFGSMTVSVGENIYKIERSFSDVSKKDEIRFYNVSDPSKNLSNNPGEYLLNIGLETFEKTLMIREVMHSVGNKGNEEIIKKLSNISESLDEEVSFNDSIIELQNQRKNITNIRKNGELDILDKDLSLLKINRNEVENKDLELNRLKFLLDDLNSEIEGINQNIEYQRLMENDEALIEIRSLIQKKQTILSMIKSDSDENLANIKVEEMEELIQKVQDFAKEEKEIDNLKKEFQEKEAKNSINKENIELNFKEFNNVDLTLEGAQEDIFTIKEGFQKISELENKEKLLKDYVTDNCEIARDNLIRVKELNNEITKKKLDILNYERKKNEILNLKDKKIVKDSSTSIRCGGNKVNNISKKILLLFILFLPLSIGLSYILRNSVKPSIILILSFIGFLVFLISILLNGKSEKETNKELREQVLNEISNFDTDISNGDIKLIDEKIKAREIEIEKLEYEIENIKNNTKEKLKNIYQVDEEYLSYVTDLREEDLKKLYDKITEEIRKIRFRLADIFQFYKSNSIEDIRNKVTSYFDKKDEYMNQLRELEEEYIKISKRINLLKESSFENSRLFERLFRKRISFEEINIIELIKYLKRCEDEIRHIEELKVNLTQIKESIDYEKERLSLSGIDAEKFLISNDGLKELDNLNMTLNDKKDKKFDVESKINEISKSFISLSDYDGDIIEKTQRRDELIKRLTILDKTIEVLNKAKDDLRRDFLPTLNNKTSYYIKNLTKENFTEVHVQDDFELRTIISGMMRDFRLLSRGTIDLFYLGLRLALCDIIFSGGKVPVLFDDSFIHLDDIRIREVINFLENSKEDKRQVIIFTCHTREMEISKAGNKVLLKR